MGAGWKQAGNLFLARHASSLLLLSYLSLSHFSPYTSHISHHSKLSLYRIIHNNNNNHNNNMRGEVKENPSVSIDVDVIMQLPPPPALSVSVKTQMPYLQHSTHAVVYAQHSLCFTINVIMIHHPTYKLCSFSALCFIPNWKCLDRTFLFRRF